MLDASRLQTGKLSFERKPIRLDKLVEETITDLNRATEGRDIKILKTKKVTVCADRFRIYQVITNLITNAIKYSPPTTPIHVKIETERKTARISVQDYGIGIDNDQQNKIFERLYQVGGETPNTFPGFGMGLYISKEIVRRHRGKIWVKSEKGKGSIFYFTLPITKRLP